MTSQSAPRSVATAKTILLLAQFLPPRKFGGEERHIWTLARGLTSRGHQVTLLGFETGDGASSPDVVDGVRLIRVKTAASKLPILYTDAALPYALPLADPLVARAISDELATRRYDVIHAHNWIVNSALGPAERSGVPLVMTLHDYSHVCATKRLMEMNTAVCSGPSASKCLRCSAAYYGAAKGALTLAANAWSARRRARIVSHFAAVSAAVARGVSPADNAGWHRVTRAGVAAEVVPNFIPDNIVCDHVPPINDGAPIVFAGDMQEDKGVHTLLQAYRLLDDPPPLLLAGRRTPATPPLVFGDAPDDGTSDRDRRASWHIPDGASYLGAVTNEEVLALFQRACIVVVPSVFADPCPTVVLEAMAGGRPVVGASSGGIADLVVDAATGYLFPPGDHAALADRLRRLLHDPATAARFGVAGRDRAREFTASSVIDSIEDLYERAAAGCVGRAR